MISIQCLYQSKEDFAQQITRVNAQKECLVQIFTTILQPEECVRLAQEIKEQLPLAHVIGSSANAVICKGEQYEQHTLIAIEQYHTVRIATRLLPTAGKSGAALAQDLCAAWQGKQPKLMRMFLGAYYDQAHQLLETTNDIMPGVEIVGGMSGELMGGATTPFVFDETQALAEGLICAGIAGGELSTYNRVNTAHERISDVYTITKAQGRTVCEIEHEPAAAWLHRTLGFASTQTYESWEEIAKRDPLVRFQIALEDCNQATRYLRFDEQSNQITQYFSQLDSGTRFRISYSSPAKCVEECKETCQEVATMPMEQLFCYDCLFRKLYLKNCAQWELTPYHKNPVSGVFLLGEFGYCKGRNELLNGSCVFSGIAEDEIYMQVDMACVEELNSIQDENEELFDFIVHKQKKVESVENEQLLADVISHEREHQPSFYRYFDSNFNIGNMLKYELDRKEMSFNKICLVKVENADILMSYMGQAGYFAQVKAILERLEQMREWNANREVCAYVGNADTFVIAASDDYTNDEFLALAQRIEHNTDNLQTMFEGTPIVLRLVVVTDTEFLLEQAYSLLELNKSSQTRMIIGGKQEQDKAATQKELECINLIQYAIAEDKVVPYYQGLYNNHTKRIDKYEALMRICDRDGNMLSPWFFMDMAKKYRLYLDLNLKMLEQVLTDFNDLEYAVSVNLCAHDIDSPRFRQVLRERLRRYRKPENITFEILEDECFADMRVLKEFMVEMRSYGAKIAIDDFGSGYSNLIEIVKIRPDFLKIDGQIIREAHRSYENEMIINVIATLGKQLSIGLVAEYVENADVQKVVDAYDIEHSQGYYFSKPQPFAQLRTVEEGVLAQAKQQEDAMKENVTRKGVRTVHSLRAQDVPTLPDHVRSLEEKDRLIASLENEKFFFEAIQSLSSDLLFRLRVKEKRVHYFGNFRAVLNLPEYYENYPESILEQGKIYPKDHDSFLEMFENIRQGIERPCFFRVYDSSGALTWQKKEYRIFFDENGEPAEVIGRVSNVQIQKELEEQMKLDTLTGCLRKHSFEHASEDVLKAAAGQSHAVMIVDLDNFKAVNDNLGHQFGDTVLTEVGEKLRAAFRGSDYVGRIGGDEFMIFVRNVSSKKMLARKASELIAQLDETYQGKSHAYRISASIGIAVYPENGSTFQTLYGHADIAMFAAKNRGKHAFAFYEPVMSKGTMENTVPLEVASRAISQYFDPKILSKTFNLLFDAVDINSAMDNLLQLIGERFAVSRAYVFEASKTTASCYDNTYEWCANGVASALQEMQCVPRVMFDSLLAMDNDTGVVYCNDIEQLPDIATRDMMRAQGIQSVLHTYIYAGNEMIYAIGFDDCVNPRIWSPIEISTLQQVSKVIAQFLNYQNALTSVENISEERLSVLDSLNYFSYIVDADTYELTYFNKYTKDKLPEIELGNHCYEALRGRGSPCHDCPLRRMRAEKLQSVRTVMDHSALGSQVLVSASRLPSYQGKESIFVSTHDVADVIEHAENKK